MNNGIDYTLANIDRIAEAFKDFDVEQVKRKILATIERFQQ